MSTRNMVILMLALVVTSGEVVLAEVHGPMVADIGLALLALLLHVLAMMSRE